MSGRTARPVSSAGRVELRGSEDRFRSTGPGIQTRHSFSFGHHYDPANTSHGVLLVSDEHRVQPGAGFGPHPHRDTEIVTWVLRGSLVHEDSAGHDGVVQPGVVQRSSAGTGIVHSERNAASRFEGDAVEPLHFVQMWVAPDEPGSEPGYEQRDVSADLVAGELVPVASGLPRHDGAAPIRIGNRSAALHVARLTPGQAVELPDAPYLHLFLAHGAVILEGAGELTAGDAVRSSATGGQRVTAARSAEVLVWEMHRGFVP